MRQVTWKVKKRNGTKKEVKNTMKPKKETRRVNNEYFPMKWTVWCYECTNVGWPECFQVHLKCYIYLYLSPHSWFSCSNPGLTSAGWKITNQTNLIGKCCIFSFKSNITKTFLDTFSCCCWCLVWVCWRYFHQLASDCGYLKHLLRSFH